jgi:hypothetical protein
MAYHHSQSRGEAIVGQHHYDHYSVDISMLLLGGAHSTSSDHLQWTWHLCSCLLFGVFLTRLGHRRHQDRLCGEFLPR